MSELNEHITNTSFEKFESLIDNEQINHAFSLNFIKIIVYTITFLLGIIGNFLVILTISINKELRLTTHIYLMNLSISDFINLLSIPFSIITSIKQDWIFNSFICKIFWLLQGINQFTSVAFISVLSIDR